MREKLLIIGNGMAAGRLLDELLRREAQEKFEITVVGEEPYGNYNRIMLSSVLAKELDSDQVMQKDKSWFAQQQVVFHCGVRAEYIDKINRQVTLANGERVKYDQLVLATGSRPAQIPAGNQQLANIFSFRGLQDVEVISQAAQGGGKALVVGGGFLGLEAAYGLAKQGLEVVLVHRGAWLLNRQLDNTAANFLLDIVQSMGIQCYLENEVAAFVGSEQLEGARLKNGEHIHCEMAVIATGISPNKELAEQSGLACETGIGVDDYLLSSDKSISALGECVEHQGATFGLVEPIWQMCRVLADRLCKTGDSRFVNQPIATKLKISGVDMLSAGDFLTRPHHRELRVVDKKNKSYRKLLLAENKIVGAVLFGDTRGGSEYFQLIEKQIDVSAVLPELIFGSAHCDFGALTKTPNHFAPLSA